MRERKVAVAMTLLLLSPEAAAEPSGCPSSAVLSMEIGAVADVMAEQVGVNIPQCERLRVEGACTWFIIGAFIPCGHETATVSLRAAVCTFSATDSGEPLGPFYSTGSGSSAFVAPVSGHLHCETPSGPLPSELVEAAVAIAEGERYDCEPNARPTVVTSAGVCLSRRSP